MGGGEEGGEDRVGGEGAPDLFALPLREALAQRAARGSTALSARRGA